MGEAISDVVVVPYDPAWPAAFRQERRRLVGAVGSSAEALHHMGSTSVAGMPAKPVIDMLMEVTDLGTLDDQAPALGALGYEALGEYGLPGRRYFRRWRDGRHTHHLHVYAAGDPAVTRHVMFRDFLRRRPQIAARYGSLKQHLAETLAHSRRDYAAGKAPFVEAVEREALAWAEGTGRKVSGVDTVLFDAMPEQLRYASCFGQLFYSCELGQAKPSAGYFNAVVRRLGTLPAQVLFLDDHQANVQAARECGLAAELYHLDQGPALLERLLDRHNVWPAPAG